MVWWCCWGSQELWQDAPVTAHHWWVLLELLLQLPLTWGCRITLRDALVWRCWQVRDAKILGNLVFPELCYHPWTAGGIAEGTRHQVSALRESGWNSSRILLSHYPCCPDPVCPRDFPLLTPGRAASFPVPPLLKKGSVFCGLSVLI